MTAKPLNIDFETILKSCTNHPKIILYRDIILIENKRINLVSRETVEDNFYNLVAESVIPVDFLKINKIKNYLDIGSGGGLPSIPIIVTGSIEKATLVERTQKKASALKRIISKLDLETEISVIDQTLEDIVLENSFDLVTLRYVKLNDKLLDKILKNLIHGGMIIYYSEFSNINSAKHVSSVTYSYTASLETHNKYFTVIQKK